jgi:hypothetical protein
MNNGSLVCRNQEIVNAENKCAAFLSTLAPGLGQIYKGHDSCYHFILPVKLRSSALVVYTVDRGRGAGVSPPVATAAVHQRRSTCNCLCGLLDSALVFSRFA